LGIRRLAVGFRCLHGHNAPPRQSATVFISAINYYDTVLWELASVRHHLNIICLRHCRPRIST
jgi:hypothetical protein